MQAYTLTIAEVLERFEYRVIGSTPAQDSEVFGPALRHLGFNNVWVQFNFKTGRVFEIQARFGDNTAYWVDPEFEVQHREVNRKLITDAMAQVFSLKSFLKIADAVEQDREFDLGLLRDIDFDLPYDLRQQMEELAKAQGVPLAKLMMDAFDRFLSTIKDEYRKEGTPTQQDA